MPTPESEAATTEALEQMAQADEDLDAHLDKALDELEGDPS
jgi:hypothetical protein